MKSIYLLAIAIGLLSLYKLVLYIMEWKRPERINLKTKAFYNTFAIPLTLCSIIILAIVTESDKKTLFFPIFYCCFFLVYLIFRGQHYFKDLQVNSDHIKISYLTAFLRQRTISLQLDSIKAIKIRKRKFLAEGAGTLVIFHTGDFFEFLILDKSLLDDIQSKTGSLQLAGTDAGRAVKV